MATEFVRKMRRDGRAARAAARVRASADDKEDREIILSVYFPRASRRSQTRRVGIGKHCDMAYDEL